MSSSREQILSRIRKALATSSVQMPYPEVEKKSDFFVGTDKPKEVVFAEEYAKLGGKFIYCYNELDMVQQLAALADTMNWARMSVKDDHLLQLFQENGLSQVEDAKDMKDISVGISLCECLVARLGSEILSSSQQYGRALPVYAPVHITIAYSNQVVWDISDAITFLNEKYHHNLPSMISLTTGPSRTADIEKTLVVGVHGPKEVYTFLIENKPISWQILQYF